MKMKILMAAGTFFQLVFFWENTVLYVLFFAGMYALQLKLSLIA
jgi:hypothetical protein